MSCACVACIFDLDITYQVSFRFISVFFYVKKRFSFRSNFQRQFQNLIYDAICCTLNLHQRCCCIPVVYTYGLCQRIFLAVMAHAHAHDSKLTRTHLIHRMLQVGGRGLTKELSALELRVQRTRYLVYIYRIQVTSATRP